MLILQKLLLDEPCKWHIERKVYEQGWNYHFNFIVCFTKMKRIERNLKSKTKKSLDSTVYTDYCKKSLIPTIPGLQNK